MPAVMFRAVWNLAFRTSSRPYCDGVSVKLRKHLSVVWTYGETPKEEEECYKGDGDQ